MNIFCSICREAFSPDSKVNATPCGHLYHVNCLDKWSEKKTTCPQCRSHIWQRAQQVQFLFKEIPDDQENSYYKQLLCDYEVIQQEEITLKSKYEELRSLQLQLRQKISDCKVEIKNSEIDIVIWEKQCNMYDQVQDIRLKLLEENEDLVKKNNLLDKLNKLINGTEAEVHEILSSVQTNECTLKELCTFVQAMKYKLQKIEDLYKRKLKKIMSLTEEYVNEGVGHQMETQGIEGKTFEDKATQTEPKAIEKLRKKLLKKLIKVRCAE